MSNEEVNGNVGETLRLTSSSVEDLSEYTDADESMSAPTEILAEFLSAVMTKDYENALKLCRQILSYEPNNTTAQEFFPLILQRLQIMQKEDESDDSSFESTDSFQSTTSSSSADISCNEKSSRDSDRTTASYSSLEDDGTKCSFFTLPSAVDTKDGNANDISTNISKDENTTTKEKKTFSSEETGILYKDEKMKPSQENLLIHPTPTTTLKPDNCFSLSRSQTYTKINNEKNTLMAQCVSKKILNATASSIHRPESKIVTSNRKKITIMSGTSFPPGKNKMSKTFTKTPGKPSSSIR